MRVRVWLPLLLLLTTAAFLPVRRSEYIQDDHLAVEENEIAARGDLSEIFGTDYWAGASGADGSLYRPVTILSYALERCSGGPPSPRVSHAVNLALHILASLLLAAAALRLGFRREVAYSTSLLFAVHPLHTEAVAGVVGRGELLAAIFTLAAITFWSWTWESGRSPGTARVAAWGAGAMVFLALGSKEIGAAVIPLLILLDLYRFRDPPGPVPLRTFLVERLAAFAPTVLGALFYLILRVQTLQAVLIPPAPHALDNPLVAMPPASGLFTALGLLPRYLFLLVFPVRLSADYSGGVIPREESLLGVLPLAGLACFLLLVLGAVLPFLPGKRVRSRVRHEIAFACSLFLLPYLVIGNLFLHVGTIFAERLVYLPSAGFCLLAAVFLAWLAQQNAPEPARPRKRRKIPVSALVLTLVLASFTLGTYARAGEWLNDESLFESVLRVFPDSPRANFIVAKIEEERAYKRYRGRSKALLLQALERPIALLQHAVKVQPDYSVGWNELGLIQARLGRTRQAAALFEKSLRLAPTFPRAHLNLAIALSAAGNKKEALSAARKAVLISPGSAKSWAQLGHLLVEAGNRDGGIRAYREAVRLGREDLRPRLESLERAGRRR